MKMDKKSNWLPVALIILVALFFVGMKTWGSEPQATPAVEDAPLATVPPETYLATPPENVSVEVFHFHGNRQCPSCVAVGALAEKTVNTYFVDEQDSGKLVFAHVNYELPQNQELAWNYQVSGSSLWIGTYIDGQFYKENNIEVWYKIQDEEDFLNYLKEVLDKRLSGDLN